MDRGRERTFELSDYKVIPIGEEDIPYVEEITYTEGGLAGFLLFDIYEYPKNYIIYLKET
jgi:hypothetical protein